MTPRSARVMRMQRNARIIVAVELVVLLAVTYFLPAPNFWLGLLIAGGGVAAWIGSVNLLGWRIDCVMRQERQERTP